MNGNKFGAVCTCNTCSGKIEFESGNAGQTIQCPHCGMETILFIPKNVSKPPHSVPNFALKYPAKSSAKPNIEAQLEMAGSILFFVGLIGFLVCIFLTVTTSQMEWILFGFVAVLQGWIFSLTFKGFAEVIRLLRK
jgi:DNA-directed RNA polymerase subunit RPC12/RpoP